jgi:hypothetical protein
LEKVTVLSTLSELKDALRHGQRGETLKQLDDHKKFISNSIASSLSGEDLTLIPTIVEAVKLAAKLAAG